MFSGLRRRSTAKSAQAASVAAASTIVKTDRVGRAAAAAISASPTAGPPIVRLVTPLQAGPDGFASVKLANAASPSAVTGVSMHLSPTPRDAVHRASVRAPASSKADPFNSIVPEIDLPTSAKAANPRPVTAVPLNSRLRIRGAVARCRSPASVAAVFRMSTDTPQ